MTVQGNSASVWLDTIDSCYLSIFTGPKDVRSTAQPRTTEDHRTGSRVILYPVRHHVMDSDYACSPSAFSVTFCSIAQVISAILTTDSVVLLALLTAAGSPSILSLLGCRLMIHLKEVGGQMEEARDIDIDSTV